MVWGTSGWGGGAVGLPEGAEQAAIEQSAEAAHTADVGQLFGGSCTSAGRSVRGAHPEGGGGVRGMVGSRQENVFLSPVILHNAGQIRLELTAEDIQLDCARHSVASIRASSCVFVFPAAEREKAACTVFLCHFHLCLWISSLYVSQNITC